MFENQDSFSSLHGSLNNRIRNLEDECERLCSVTNSYRAHCSYLLAINKFCREYLKEALLPEEFREVEKRSSEIETFIQNNTVSDISHDSGEDEEELIATFASTTVWSPDKNNNWDLSASESESDSLRTSPLESARTRRKSTEILKEDNLFFLPLLEGVSDNIVALLETEKVYIENLLLTIECFIGPVEEIFRNNGMFLPQQVKNFFECIKALYDVHFQFFDELVQHDQLKESGTQQNEELLRVMGSAFYKMCESLDLFHQFFSLEGSCKEIIEEWRSKELFHQLEYDLSHNHACSTIGLDEFQLRIFPLYRIQHYIILIESLVRSTTTDNQESCQQLIMSITNFNKLLSDIDIQQENQKFALQKTSDVMLSIVWPKEKKLKYGLKLERNPNRVLVYHGPVKKFTKKHLWVPRYLMLFNDVLLLTEKRIGKTRIQSGMQIFRKKKEHYIVKSALDLSNFELKPITDQSIGTSRNTFLLVTVHPEMKFYFKTSSEVELKEWQDHLRSCLIELPSVVSMDERSKIRSWQKLVDDLDDIIPLQ